MFKEGCFVNHHRIFQVDHSFKGNSDIYFTKKAVYNSLKIGEVCPFVTHYSCRSNHHKILVRLCEGETFILFSFLGELIEDGLVFSFVLQEGIGVGERGEPIVSPGPG